MHQQHRSWFLRATAMVYSTSMARFSFVSVSLSVFCHRCIVVKRCEIGPRLLLMTNTKSHNWLSNDMKIIGLV